MLNGERAGLLPTSLAGGPGGSLFLARERRLTSRKHWIAFTLRPRGQIHLDQGAVEALTSEGKACWHQGFSRSRDHLKPATLSVVSIPTERNSQKAW